MLGKYFFAATLAAPISLVEPPAPEAASDQCIITGRATGTPVKLVWATGFEGVSLGSIYQDSPGNILWYNDLSGIDTLTGNDQTKHIWGGVVRVQRLATSTVATPSIVTTAGPFGGSTKALHLQVVDKADLTNQNPLIVENISNVPDFYISGWYKIPVNTPDILKTYSGDYDINAWVTLGPEWKAAWDFRSVMQVFAVDATQMKWRLRWDNAANGGLAYQEFQHVWNSTVPVPLGQWLQIEYFNHRDATDGCTWVAVNGTTVLDLSGNNIGINNGPINRIFPANSYALEPIDQYFDNFVVYEGMPSEEVRSDLRRGFMPSFCAPTLREGVAAVGC